MNLGLAAAWSLILGFVLILSASFATSPRLYRETEAEARLQIIADQRAGWIASNLLWGLGGLVTAVGLVLLALHLRGSVNGWLLGLAAGTFLLGGIAWAIFQYQRTADPVNYFKQSSYPPAVWAYLWLTVIGLILFGVVFLRAGYPAWLGNGTIFLTALIGLAGLLFPAQMIAAFPPQLIYLMTLIAGIVILRT